MSTTEEMKSNGTTYTDEMSVAGDELVGTVQSLLREAVVRRIVVKDKNGRTLIEIPLYAGVIGALVMGAWSALALVAAWFAEVSILIERDYESDEETAVDLGEWAGRAIGATTTAVGSAARGASDWAAKAADSLEQQLKTADAPAEKVKSNGSASKKQAKAEPGRCQALTKSGSQCKNNALEGSDFCGVHQPK